MKTWILKLAWFTLCLWIMAAAQAPSPADALALEQQGKLAEAADAWRTVTERDPNNAGAFASLGLVLSREEKYPEAVSAYGKALLLNPKLPGVQLDLGLAEFKQGDFQAAIAPFKAALAADSRNQQARTLLGLSYYGAKRFPEAARQLQLVVKANPANAELLQVLAQSCLWAKEYSCALAQVRQILQQSPDSASAHILTGEALDGLHRTPEAIAEFQAAGKVAPREPGVHFGLGYLYWKSRQYDDAKRELEAELSLDPGNAQALAYLGDIEMKRNNPEGALSFLRESTKKGNVRLAYIDLGAILAEQKQYEDAVAALQRAVQLDPTEPDAHYRLGRIYQGMGNDAKSKAEFAEVRRLHQEADESLAPKMSSAPPPLNQQ